MSDPAGVTRPDLMTLKVERETAQGNRTRRMSLDQCERLLLRVPGEAAPLGPNWKPGEQSPANPYYTPQENTCMALSRDQDGPADNTFPGWLPRGATAVPLGGGAWQISR